MERGLDQMNRKKIKDKTENKFSSNPTNSLSYVIYCPIPEAMLKQHGELDISNNKDIML